MIYIYIDMSMSPPTVQRGATEHLCSSTSHHSMDWEAVVLERMSSVEILLHDSWRFHREVSRAMNMG